MITDRDLVVRALAVDADLVSTPVGECATGAPVVAHPDWDLDQAMETMARGQIGRLPVIDDDNVLVGIVTLGSLALRSRKDKETLEAAKAVSRRSVKAAMPRRGSSTQSGALADSGVHDHLVPPALFRPIHQWVQWVELTACFGKMRIAVPGFPVGARPPGSDDHAPAGLVLHTEELPVTIGFSFRYCARVSAG